jgi:hypothetical protein
MFVILPLTAEIAAVIGEHRYMSASAQPILPTKFLFEVDKTISPFAGIPW